MRASLRLKRTLAMVATGALALSLLPGVAFADAVDFSDVCEGAEDSGFEDKGDAHGAAIDCLNSYTDANGDPIFRGQLDGTAGTFAPISRGAFASLVFRFGLVANPDLGDLVDEDDVVDFPDVNEDGVHTPAIEALSALGIVEGRTDGTFGVFEPISRGAAASITFRAHEALGVTFDDEYDEAFADQGDTHGFAIAALADLGIVEGRDDGSFGTFANIGRGASASILARSAQVLKDAGIWTASLLIDALSLEIDPMMTFFASADVIEVTATYVDDEGNAISNARLELAGFEDEVELTVDGDIDELFGAGEITASSPQTDANGQVTFSIDTADIDGVGTDFPVGDYVVAVWAGAVGTSAPADADAVAVGEFSVIAPTDGLDVTTSELLPFGSADEVVVQLQAAGDDVAQAGVAVQLQTAVGGGSLAPQIVETDASGAATFNVTSPAEPDPAADVVYDYTVVADLNGDGIFGPAPDLTDASGETTWTADDPADDLTVELTAVGSTSPEGVGAAAVDTTTSFSVEVTDLFGNAVAGYEVDFSSTDGGGFTGPNRTVTTNADGEAVYTFRGPVETGDEVTVTATVDIPEDGSVNGTAFLADGDTEAVEGLVAFFVEADADDVATNSLIWARDGATVVLAVDGGGYASFTWAAGDQFNETGEGAVSQAAFGTLVAEAESGNLITVDPYNPAGVSIWTFTG